MRMALERASEFAQIESRARIAETVMGGNGIKRGRTMAFGQHEAVAIGIADGVGPEIEFGAEQAGQEIGDDIAPPGWPEPA
jgi:hypothetical protein